MTRRHQVGVVTLDRPAKANAYDRLMLDQLETALHQLHDDSEIRVVVIGSSGKHFCAGADLEEIRSRKAEDALELKSAGVFDLLAGLPEVSIAAIGGAAVGGGLELALACDLRVAAPDAFFELPELRHGIIPAAGGTFRLAQVVGRSRAKAMILGGERVDAEEALRWGLVNRLALRDSLETTVLEWAARIARQDPLALRLAKQAIDASGGEGTARRLAQVSQALLYELAGRDGVG